MAVPSGGVLTLNSNYTLDGSRLAVGDTASAYVEYQVSSLQQDSAIDAQGIAVGLKAWNGASFFETRWCF
ncbi:hypothetical protein, partial [Halomonas sp. ND22Bw]|uniref:hypothetical protein n=1 Tax=Halomonas sp. ND22Bw TaxID=2054178 RepID=UPI001C63B3CC